MSVTFPTERSATWCVRNAANMREGHIAMNRRATRWHRVENRHLRVHNELLGRMLSRD